jgi:hypothetical protein
MRDLRNLRGLHNIVLALGLVAFMVAIAFVVILFVFGTKI